MNPITNGHDAPPSRRDDKTAQLRQLNREYQPLLTALCQNEASATHANKLAQMEYHRKRKEILRSDEVSARVSNGNGHDSQDS